MKIYSPKISPCHRTIYFSRLLELILVKQQALNLKFQKKRNFFGNVYFKGQLLDWLFPILEVAVVRV